MTEASQDERLEGMREALAVLAEEEAKWAAKMVRPAPRATREARRIRWQAYRSAQQRIRTVIARREKAQERRLAAFLSTLAGIEWHPGEREKA